MDRYSVNDVGCGEVIYAIPHKDNDPFLVIFSGGYKYGTNTLIEWVDTQFNHKGPNELIDWLVNTSGSIGCRYYKEYLATKIFEDAFLEKED